MHFILWIIGKNFLKITERGDLNFGASFISALSRAPGHLLTFQNQPPANEMYTSDVDIWGKAIHSVFMLILL